MDDAQTRDTGRVVIAVGVVAIGSAACLAAFFAVGGPFGTINDIGNATTGVLSAAVAWRMRSRIPGRRRGVAVGAALAGAAATVIGSALVVSGTTGFFLAGLVSSVGFAGIGAWLVALNRGKPQDPAWPARLRGLGVIGGVLMAVGVVAVPGVILRLDDMASAPAWVWIGFLSWLGLYVVYPAWALWAGAVETGRSSRQLTDERRGHAAEGEEARSWTGG
jgi:hypothetical protein